jgi:hypothetical protein
VRRNHDDANAYGFRDHPLPDDMFRVWRAVKHERREPLGLSFDSRPVFPGWVQ